MECGKIVTPMKSKLISGLILHVHDCIFLVRRIAEDEFEAQTKHVFFHVMRTHIRPQGGDSEGGK